MKSVVAFSICLLVLVAIIFVSLPSAEAQWGYGRGGWGGGYGRGGWGGGGWGRGYGRGGWGGGYGRGGWGGGGWGRGYGRWG